MKRAILILLLFASPALADNLGAWRIDDALTFSASVHNATGAAVAADGSVYWRVYENETGTALLNGTMTRIDSTNFPGTYTEAITLSAANGFEVGKMYTVAIKAGVESVTGEKTHNFQVEAFANYRADVSALATAAAIAALNDFDPTSDTVTVGTNNDKTGYSVSTLGANTITAGVIATDAIGSDEVAASAVTEIQSGLATAANVTSARDAILDVSDEFGGGGGATANEVRDAILAATIGDFDLETALERIHVWATGKFTKSGNNVDYFNQADQKVFGVNIFSSSRTNDD